VEQAYAKNRKQQYGPVTSVKIWKANKRTVEEHAELYNLHPFFGGALEPMTSEHSGMWGAGYERPTFLPTEVSLYLSKMPDRCTWDNMFAEWLTTHRSSGLSAGGYENGRHEYLLPLTVAPATCVRVNLVKGPGKKNVPKMDYEKVVPLWAQYMRVHRARIEFATDDAIRQVDLHVKAMERKFLLLSEKDELFPYIQFKVWFVVPISSFLWTMIVEEFGLLLPEVLEPSAHEGGRAYCRCVTFVTAAGRFMRLLPWPPINEVSVTKLTLGQKCVLLTTLNMGHRDPDDLYCEENGLRWSRDQSLLVFHSQQCRYGSAHPFFWATNEKDDPCTFSPYFQLFFDLSVLHLPLIRFGRIVVALSWRLNRLSLRIACVSAFTSALFCPSCVAVGGSNCRFLCSVLFALCRSEGDCEPEQAALAVVRDASGDGAAPG